MKKLYKIFSLIFATAVVGISATQAQTYCVPSFRWGCSSYGDVNSFSTTGGIANISNLNTGCNGGYVNNTTMVHMAAPGDTVGFEINSGGFTGAGQAIWVDWNNDGDFDDLGEEAYYPTTFSYLNYTTTDQFVIPTSALPGTNLRMRVVATYYWYAQNLGALAPCPNGNPYFYYGEVEDYSLFVIPPFKNDAGIQTILTPSVGICSLGTISTKVLLNNFGNDPLTSATVNWSVNGSAQTAFSFSGTVAALGGVSDTVTLGNFTYNDGDNLMVWTTNPNGIQDSFPNNDTMLTTVYEALGGSYTIGGTNPDYATFNDAVTALEERGVCSPVTMTIAGGIYNEKVSIGSIPGASSSNTTTFTNDPADTNIVEISSSQNIDSNYVINFNNTMYVTFSNITIDGSTGGTYGTAVSFSKSDYCKVSDCIINGINTTSTSNTLYTINGSDGMNNSFMNNDVTGGSYALYWRGGENITIEENTFADPYYYGVYVTEIEMLKFNGNHLSAQSSYQYGYGLYAYNIDGASEFVGNYLNWPGYSGAYFRDINGSNTEHPLIANNMIRSGSGNYYAYGVYLYNSGYVSFVNNTIAKDPWTTNGGFYGIYVSGGANKLLNNIFYDPNGSPSYYNFYYSGSFSVSESDYNNVYSKQNFGYLNGLHQTLSAWQNSTGFDMNSTTIDPGYVNLDSLRHCNDSLDGTGTPLVYVLKDYDKDGRNTSTPDVGADEWVGSTPGSYSAGDDAIVCDGKTVEIGLAVTGGTFSWSTGDTTSTIVVSTSGTYIVTMTSACGATLGDTVEVVDVTPTSDFTGNHSFLTGQFTNNSVNGDTYMWVVNVLPPDTFYSMDLTYVFPDNGPYDVDLYVRNDCDTIMSTHEWSGVVSVEEISLENLVTLMPNPATDVLNIQFAGFDGDVTIEMTNIQGQIIYTERYMNVSGNATKSIDVSSLRKGMYIIKFITVDEVTAKQIIVQ